MSLVSLIATSEFLSFVSDGRVINSDKKEIIAEDYKKITKVNSKIIFSVTGDYYASKIINENVHLFDNKNAERFARSMFNMLGNGKVTKNMGILIGGINEKGNIYYAGFQENSTELIEITPRYGEIRHAVTLNEITEKIDLQQVLSNFIRSKISSFRELTLEKSFQIQKDFHAFVSEKDYSVNNNIYWEYVIKN